MIKKLIPLLLITIVMFSCGDDIEFNSPMIQANLNGDIWRADAFTASIGDNGYLTIMGVRGPEVLELTIPSTALGVYYFGDVDAVEAKFTSVDGTVFSSANAPESPDSPCGVYPEIGELRLLEIINNTFTGTFRFNAFDTNCNVINFTGTLTGTPYTGLSDDGTPIYGGLFYRIPLTSGTIPATPLTCADAIIAVDAVAELYNIANTPDENGIIDSANYLAACTAYIDALKTQQIYCNDLDGVIQSQIDALGDCIISCEIAAANTAVIENQYNNATLLNFVGICNQYTLFIQEQMTICGDADGTLQNILDGLDCADDDGDTVPNAFEDLNGDGNLDNDDTDGDGTPDYLDDDDDNDGVPTAIELQLDDSGNPLNTDADMLFNYRDNDDDGDGVLTQFEDPNSNNDATDDDTDGDSILNYLDNDDDGDSILTAFELFELMADGDPTDAQDFDTDAIPDYLDSDDDGDSIFTIFELFETMVDGDPIDARDYDSDTNPDYLDNDDDNDGNLTINENPDPNGDGDPTDAVDTDTDGIPDYLDIF